MYLRRLRDFTKKDIFFEMYLRRLKDITKKASFKICFWDILETSENNHLFWDMFGLRRLKDSTWKTFFFEMFLRRLKEVTKKGIFFETYMRRLKDVWKKTSLLRCFWEVFEMSVSMEICLRHLKDISCRLGIAYTYSRLSTAFAHYLEDHL